MSTPILYPYQRRYLADKARFKAGIVEPLNDLREHEANGSCWCKPTLDEGVRVLLNSAGDWTIKKGT